LPETFPRFAFINVILQAVAGVRYGYPVFWTKRANLILTLLDQAFCGNA